MEESPKDNKLKTPNPTQNAMKFLKRNLATEGSRDKDGNFAGKEKAGPHERVYTANSNPYDFRRPRVFDQMASDRFGEELAPDAAIWNIYLDEAQDRDRELVEGRQRSLDTLLLFAALFSAILTAFLIESKDLLQQDPAEASVALLLIIAQSQQRVELGLPAPEESTQAITIPEFTPSFSARWINGIWFMSLGLSLSAALIAMLGKEWLTTFQSSRPRSTRRLAFIRQSRLKGLEDWGALHIVALLPTLLHISLLLFSVGLVLYLWALDVAVASVLSVVIGVTLVFYLVTGILGAVYEFCPFVTEVSEYTRKAVAAIFRPPRKDPNNEALGASIKDLEAMAWLSKHSVDPIVVDYAYQAIAGLHRSPYITLDTPRPVLDLRLYSGSSNQISLLDNDTTMESLLLDVSGHFEDLLAGTLETGSSEPPVCRYINAMIALVSSRGKSTNTNLMSWLDLLKRIDLVWGSTLLHSSMSAGSFAGVLIAEMDVLRFATDELRLPKPESDSLPEKLAGFGLGHQESELPDPTDPGQYTINVDSPTNKDESSSSILLRMNHRLVEWIDISLTLLRSHVEGETDIDSHLLNGLFRAISDGASCLELLHEALSSQNPDYAAPEPRNNRLNSLKILIFLLSQPANSSLGSVSQLTQILKVFSCIAPVMLHHLRRSKGNSLSYALKMCMKYSNSPGSRREVLCLSTRYMVLTARHLYMLPEFPQSIEVVKNALVLIFDCAVEDNDADEGPRAAIRHHISDFICILELIGSKESNIELIDDTVAHRLCSIATFPIDLDIPANGLYIPPSCFLTLMRLYARTHFPISGIMAQMKFILDRLRSAGVSLSQLPLQISPPPEPRPSVEYLHQFTRISGGFLALVEAVLEYEHYSPEIVTGIANITIIAANHDAALEVEPVELMPPAVPAFLDALAWALPRLSDNDDKNLYHRFILAASVLLVAACEDPESREKILTHPDRATLLKELRDDKGSYIQLVSEEEWKRLIDGLASEESDVEGTERDSTSEKGEISEPGEAPKDEGSSGGEGSLPLGSTQATTPGHKPLPCTTTELGYIKSHVENKVGYLQLTGSQATPSAVLDAMEKHAWVHLACHAHQNAYDLTKSGLFLHGDLPDTEAILDLATINRRSFKGKGLAFLSACQTAAGDEALPDEAVHLASGMLMAGYSSVIATMWSVVDDDAPLVADNVYGELMIERKLGNGEAGRALHKAVAELRDMVGEKEFGRWVPYIHIGS